MTFNGFHYDIARGAYLRPAVLIEAMQLAADNGFTHFVPYLENMIALPAMRKASPSCAYTPDQWREFDASAQKIGIDLVPHFNVIGHSTQICAAYPHLAGPHGGDELDVTLPVVHDWLADCLHAFCDCSTSDWFLIGGDEWLAPNHLRANPSFDIGRAWADQINRAVDLLAERGRTPIVWHDMLMHYPDALHYLSKKAVLAFWFYDHDSDYPIIDSLKAHGFRVIMSSGIFGCHFTKRTEAAIETAVQAVEKHGADGMMMTSWETTPWEAQRSVIPLTAEAYAGKALPQAILTGGAINACLAKVPAGTCAHADLASRLQVNLEDPEWSRFPLQHGFLKATIAGDRQAILDSYCRYHYPEGPLYDRLAKVAPRPIPNAPAPAIPPRCFELDIVQDPQAGDCLRVSHGDERFIVYPRYGATLQNWTFGSATIIPHMLPAFLERPRQEPGGYRGWNAVGGMRPIWALGTHHNPCILWQYPWQWDVSTHTADRIVLAFRKSLSHVDVTYEIAVDRDRPGIRLSLTAVNKLPNAYGAFSFNLPLALDPHQLHDTRFAWDDHTESLLTPAREAFWLPARENLQLSTPYWTLRIAADKEETAGFFVDWGCTMVTPDLHGLYKPRHIGEATTVTWHLTPSRQP